MPKRKRFKVPASELVLDLDFFVEGVPQAWQRAGVNTETGVHYTPEATRKWKDRMVWTARMLKVLPKQPTSWPCKVFMLFYFPEPKSFRLKSGQLSAQGRKHLYDGELWCTNQRDVDNLAKSVQDAFNGLIWGDDRQLRIVSEKAYTREKPGVQIRVMTPKTRGQ